MTYGGLFDIDKKISSISKLEIELNDPNIWNDQDRAHLVIENMNLLKSSTEEISILKKELQDNLDTVLLLEEFNDNDFRTKYRKFR